MKDNKHDFVLKPLKNKQQLIQNYIHRMKGRESCPARTTPAEMWWSWLGAFISIIILSLLSKYVHLETIDKILMISSFGSSAVLIYGSPEQDSAQPRNLLGGHFISSTIGVTLVLFFPFHTAVLAALSVSISMLAMQWSRTFHPPAGATALTAVIGSQQIYDLGYLFVFMPVLSGSLILLVIALLINNLSNNNMRHYPRYWV